MLDFMVCYYYIGLMTLIRTQLTTFKPSEHRKLWSTKHPYMWLSKWLKSNPIHNLSPGMNQQTQIHTEIQISTTKSTINHRSQSQFPTKTQITDMQNMDRQWTTIETKPK